MFCFLLYLPPLKLVFGDRHKDIKLKYFIMTYQCLLGGNVYQEHRFDELHVSTNMPDGEFALCISICLLKTYFSVSTKSHIPYARDVIQANNT